MVIAIIFSFGIEGRYHHQHLLLILYIRAGTSLYETHRICQLIRFSQRRTKGMMTHFMLSSFKDLSLSLLVVGGAGCLILLL